MRADNQQDRISDTLNWCEMHWLVTEVPPEEIKQMRDELQQHLEEATCEGKTVETVIGADAIAFAEEWAAHARPSKPLKWKILGWVHNLSGYVLLLLVAGHLLNWSLVFPTTPTIYLYGFVAIALASLWFNSMPLAGSLRFDGPPVRQVIACAAVALGTMVALTGINLITSLGAAAPLSDWSWTGTLVVLLVSLIPGKPGQDLDALPLRPDERSS